MGGQVLQGNPFCTPQGLTATNTGAAPDRTTKVTGLVSLDPDPTKVYGVTTVGGRQSLRVQNGALDLRWHMTQGFNSAAESKSGAFDPAGNAATFGFLSWWLNSTARLYTVPESMYRSEISPQDSRDPNLYQRTTVPATLQAFMPYSQSYYWYDPALGSDNYISRTKDKSGFSLYYEYDGAKLLTKICGDVGRLTPYFGYDGSGRINRMYLQDVLNEDHRATYYYYDASGSMQSIVEPENVISYFKIEGSSPDWFLTQETDPELYTTYLVYDYPSSNYRLRRMQQLDTITYFAVNWSGTTVQSQSEVLNGVSPRYYMGSVLTNSHGYEVNNGGVDGSTRYYVYDSNSCVIGEVDPAGNTWGYGTLNARKLRDRFQTPDGAVTYYYYESNGTDLSVVLGPRTTPAAPQATYYSYTAPALVSAELNAIGSTTYYGYDSRLRLSQAVDARQNPVYFYYDAFSNIEVAQDALGQCAYFDYNANGRIARIHDPLARTTYYTYDQLDQMKSQLSPTGDTKSYAYTKRGQVCAEGRPQGRATYYAYDGYKNLVAQARVDANGLIASYYGYDNQLNRIRNTDPNGNTTYFGFDARHLLARQAAPLNATSYFAYDAVGNRTLGINPNGLATSYRYDAVSRLTQRIRGVSGLEPPQKASILAHWTLDETSGNRLDDSGNNLTLYPKNPPSPSYAPGIISNAAHFAGATYFAVDGTSAPAPTTEFTLAAWARFDSIVDNYNPIAGKDNFGSFPVDGYSFGLMHEPTGPRPGNYMYVFVNGFTIQGSMLSKDLQIIVGNWHHYAVTFTGGSPGTVRFYLDGFLLSEQTVDTSSVRNAATNFKVGTSLPNSGGNLHLMNGDVDEVYVYGKALTSAEVAFLAQQRVEVTFQSNPSDLLTTYYQYDLDGNQAAVTDEASQTAYYGYDLVNRLTQSLDAAGGSTYYAYDAVNNLTTLTNPRNATTYYGYDALNRETQSLDALSRATYFVYDAVSNRTGQLSPGARTAYWRYDGSNRVIASVDGGGSTTYFGYDVVGNQDRTLNPRGFATYFAYDLLDRRVATLDATLQPTYFGYDNNGNLTRQQDHIAGALSATTYFGYDALNRPIQQMDAVGRSTYFGYDFNGNRLQVLRPGNPAQATYFGYDRFDRLSRTASPTLDATYYGYDNASNVTRSLNPRQYATYFGYDAIDRMTESLDALSGAQYFRYDANSNLVRQRDVRGNWTYFEYDILDRLTATTDPLLNQTQRGYDQAGNLAVVNPPTGGAAYFAYDSRNLLTASADGLLNTTYFAYDANGNRAAALSPRQYATYFGYDALDRLSATRDPQGAAAYFGYDAGGNLSRVLDPLSRATYFGYDLIDRITAVQDALGNSTYFGYDLAGNRSVERDADGNSTYYYYDSSNRLTNILDPLGVSSYYSYDPNSNLSRTVDNQRTVIYFEYDALDRRTKIYYTTLGYGSQPYGTSPYGGGSLAQYFGYDAASNLTAMLDAWGASYFSYDSVNRLSQRVTPRLDAVYYGYDGASNLLRLQYPQDNLTCYYGYDAAQRMTQLRTPYGNDTYWQYDASSNVSRKQYGNGMVSWATFDGSDRILSLRYERGGTAIAYFDYNRDIAGRINRICRETDLAIYYSYDSVDRLLSETWRKQSDNSQIYGFTYEYDPAGNRLKMRRETAAGTEYESTYYSYAADNSLTKRRNQTANVDTYYYYDLNGALQTQVEGASITYFEYTPSQLISKITPPTGSSWNFYYDARLNRYGIDRGGAFAYFLWDGLNNLEERDTSGNLTARFTHGYTQIYGIGSVVEAKRFVAAATYFQYPVMDHRGTVYAMVDQTGTTQISYVQDAFGVQLAGVGGSLPAVPNELIYQTNWQTFQIGGKWWGLSAARLYDSNVGAFVQRDPLRTISQMQIPGGFENVPPSDPLGNEMNAYRYTRNNPVNRVDSAGLDDEVCGPVEDLTKRLVKLGYSKPDASKYVNAITKAYETGKGLAGIPKDVIQAELQKLNQLIEKILASNADKRLKLIQIIVQETRIAYLLGKGPIPGKQPGLTATVLVDNLLKRSYRGCECAIPRGGTSVLTNLVLTEVLFAIIASPDLGRGSEYVPDDPDAKLIKQLEKLIEEIEQEERRRYVQWRFERLYGKTGEPLRVPSTDGSLFLSYDDYLKDKERSEGQKGCEPVKPQTEKEQGCAR